MKLQGCSHKGPLGDPFPGWALEERQLWVTPCRGRVMQEAWPGSWDPQYCGWLALIRESP